MRLLFVGRRYWPAVGGVEILMRGIARDLARRHSVTVLALRIDDGDTTRLSDGITARRPFEPFVDGDVAVLPLHLPLARRLLLLPQLAVVTPGLRRFAYGRTRVAIARQFAGVVAPLLATHVDHADAVVVFAGDLLGAAAVRAAKEHAKPVIVSPSAHRGQWGDDPASSAVYTQADAVVAHLDSEAQLYRDLGVPSTTIRVLGAGTPPLPDSGDVRARYGIHGPLVLFLGARRPYKGLDVLLAAAKLLDKLHPRLTVAVVGPGPRLDDAPPNVIDVGEVDECERAAWLRAATCLCLPSSGESFGLVVTEAWSVGTPVVVSDIPVFQELVGRTGGGLLVPRDPPALAAALNRLAVTPDLRRALGSAGYRAWVERFSLQGVAARYERLLLDLTPSPLTVLTK